MVADPVPHRPKRPEPKLAPEQKLSNSVPGSNSNNNESPPTVRDKQLNNQNQPSPAERRNSAGNLRSMKNERQRQHQEQQLRGKEQERQPTKRNSTNRSVESDATDFYDNYVEKYTGTLDHIFDQFLDEEGNPKTKESSNQPPTIRRPKTSGLARQTFVHFFACSTVLFLLFFLTSNF